MRSEGFFVNEKSTDTSWDRTSDLRIKLQILITDCNEELNYLYGSLNIVSVIKKVLKVTRI